MDLPTIEKNRILLVDEDRDELNWLGQILRLEGYDVDACNCFDEGADCAARGHYDFVLISQGGPDFEGHRVLERATERDRHTPVLVLARCMEMTCYLEAMQLGALDYLEKPVPVAFLVRTIETHLRPHARAAA
jgi:DNA-binding response OmpR family regulator